MPSQLMLVTAAMEVGAGLALLLVPAVIIELLFGPGAGLAPAAGMARLAGAALLAIGLGCWLGRSAGPAHAAPIVAAVLVYNIAVIVLVFAGSLGPLGPLQLGAAGLHGAMAVWCVRVATSRTP